MEAAMLLESIKERVREKNIYELRQIARAVGVSRPAEGNRRRLIEDIIKIASTQMPAAPRSARGAPPKSAEYDKELVADIQSCIRYFSAVRDGESGEEQIGLASDCVDFRLCAGILRLGQRCGYLTSGCLSSPHDVVVHETFINRFGLRDGDFIEGKCVLKEVGGAYGLTAITHINFLSPDAVKRKNFSEFTPVYPNKKIPFDAQGLPFARAVDIICPVGMGQRMIVSVEENADKAECIRQIASAVSKGGEVVTDILLLDARPEDVTCLKRSLPKAEVFFTGLGTEKDGNAEAVSNVSSYLKSRVECGFNVFLIADAANYDLAKKLMSLAINAEEGASLTVMVFVPEYLDGLKDLIRAANGRLKITGRLANGKIFTGIDISQSHTEHSEVFAGEEGTALTNLLTRCGADFNLLMEEIKNTPSNGELLKKYNG